jgi:ATP-dependent RNA helicase DOB1
VHPPQHTLCAAQVIVFSFSKKECEKLALNMAQLDLNDEDEKKLVDTIYWNAMDCLSEVGGVG